MYIIEVRHSDGTAIEGVYRLLRKAKTEFALTPLPSVLLDSKGTVLASKKGVLKPKNWFFITGPHPLRMKEAVLWILPKYLFGVFNILHQFYVERQYENILHWSMSIEEIMEELEEISCMSTPYARQQDALGKYNQYLLSYD